MAELLNFLWIESVSSEPDFQDAVISLTDLQEGFCTKVGDAVVGQPHGFLLISYKVVPISSSVKWTLESNCCME